MKNIICFLLLCASFCHAQPGFDKGNAFYRQEKYEDAVAAYESVLKTNNHSAELYFNLGNAYYKLNKVAPAIYNFEKALLLKPGDSEIRNNLKFAHSMMIDEVKEVPKAGFGKLITDFTSVFHYNAWAWIAVGFAFMFLAFFAGYYFSAAALHKRIFFIGMLVLLFLMVIAVISALHEKNRYENERPAIIFDGIVSVKSEPKSSSGDVITLHEGTKVYVLEVLDDWKKVQLPDGNDGWVQTTSLKEIK